MSESEGSRSEGVQYGGVDLAVVFVAVAVAHWEDVELGHVVRAQHQGQPLVVGDVLSGESQLSVLFAIKAEPLSHLILSDDNLPGLLVKSLIVPVRVEVAELLGQPGVFPHPDSVEHSQTRLLVGAGIS